MIQLVDVSILTKYVAFQLINFTQVVKVVISNFLEHTFHVLKLEGFLLVCIGHSFLKVKIILQGLVFHSLIKQVLLKKYILAFKLLVLLLESIELLEVPVRAQ
jgi:hypothetical protein